MHCSESQGISTSPQKFLGSFLHIFDKRVSHFVIWLASPETATHRKRPSNVEHARRLVSDRRERRNGQVETSS
jgi:hypothetical protein